MPVQMRPAQIDFSALATLPDQFMQGQQWADQRRLKNAFTGGLPMQNGVLDYGAMANIFAQSGAPDQAVDVLSLKQRMDQTAADKDWERAYKMQALGLTERRLDLQEEKANKLAPADKRALYEAEDELPQIDGAIEALTRAKDINDKTFSGVGAGARGALGAKLPDWMVPDVVADPETAKLTNEWQLIMSPEALNQMASTLKGATTDFELRNYINYLANPETPPETRKRIIDRMLSLANKKKKINLDRIETLGGQRGGALPVEAPPVAGPEPRRVPTVSIDPVTGAETLAPVTTDIPVMAGAADNPISRGPMPLPRAKSALEVGQVYNFPNGKQGLWNGKVFEVLN